LQGRCRGLEPCEVAGDCFDIEGTDILECLDNAALDVEDVCLFNVGEFSNVECENDEDCENEDPYEVCLLGVCMIPCSTNAFCISSSGLNDPDARCEGGICIYVD
jgi:hypothetical protein